MINLEKIKWEKCQSPPFKNTCPCTIIPHPVFNFSDFPPPGEAIKIYFLTFKNGKRRGGGGFELC